MNETLIAAFIVVTCVAVIIQAGILVALFFSVKKSSARMETIANNLESRAIPLMESTRAILEDTGPHFKEVASNMAEISNTVKSQVQRMDATVTDLIDRTQSQAARVDELVTRTIDKVEETTDMVQHTVITPVRQISGVVQGLSVALTSYLQRRRKAMGSAPGAVEDEELFI
jgi:ABC-type transporter Mla subunit MlaD